MALKLHGTPLSHFTRKIRILLGELGVQHEMVWLPTVMAASPGAFADNPLMRVPTLLDGDRMLIESDHIARYIVGRYDPSDWFGVKTDDPHAMNMLAVTNGIMANEVVLILAKRGGLEDIDGVAYFRKLKAAIEQGLDWLETKIQIDAPMSYADITLVCMWDHLRHYKLVPVDRYTRIAERAAKWATRPAVASTTPEASLATATAAGWKPPS
jgi:glutathione S-transferase